MIMDAENNGLPAALADVRRAYRLLWGFQKRVLCYNGVIRETLGFTHWNGTLLFDAPFWNPETRWVWDQLPMAWMHFRSYRRKDLSQYHEKKWSQYARANDAVLYTKLLADTGFPEAARTEPNPITFPSPEECKTTLSVFILVNRIDRDGTFDWWNISGDCSKLRPGSGETLAHPKFPGVDIFGMDFDLVELPDEDAVRSSIDKFRAAFENSLHMALCQLSNEEAG